MTWGVLFFIRYLYGMNKKLKISLFFGIIGLISFFGMHILIYFELISVTEFIIDFSFYSKALIIASVMVFINQYLIKNKHIEKESKYSKKLNDALITQSHNSLFYNGDIKNGAKILTKEVTETMSVDRCSIWLYNEDKTSIKCQQLYVKSDEKFYDNLELFLKEFKPYFISLFTNPVIIANDAETHPATSCFKESYLKPLGIKSMLDVPIYYENDVIGVLCIESFTLREWTSLDINFSELLSSLYSFAYSVKQNNDTKSTLNNFEKFVDSSVLISKTDKYGNITYVNQKFTDVSGWSYEDVIGKNHSIVNSGKHPKEYWTNMYKTVITEKGIWNNIVTNKTKNGEFYYVDTYISAFFDYETGNLEGFMSIRQDVTELYEKLNEINQKNVYLEHAAKILRHDMHSGINTYIPRGITSLERRLDDEVIKKYKLEPPLKLIKEGLKHTQKVYRGVYEFTNLVKKNVTLNKESYNLKTILDSYLSSTAYSSQVAIDNLPTIDVNESLFCTAVDNLIRNGLKYNDSEFKMVAIFMEDEEHLCIQDNGRGLTQEEFEKLGEPYVRKDDQQEEGSGLGLNICISILKEHGFEITCEKNETGTKMKIKI
jgi:PAS domain S-box-containing protein